ncbi:MAG: hypothetical protein DRJ40_00110 [Thermoprotei archaeon]|nr:MAG: hypothetical protein DRJ40_00110 [Thermoprotei archaeon]
MSHYSLFFKLLNYVAPNLGSVLYFHLKRLLGRDPTEILVKEPRKVYEVLKTLNAGDERTTDFFIESIVRAIERECGITISITEFIYVMKSNDSERFREILDRMVKHMEKLA